MLHTKMYFILFFCLIKEDFSLTVLNACVIFHITGLIYKMLLINHPKCDLTIISQICARNELNELKLARNRFVSALCFVNDS